MFITSFVRNFTERFEENERDRMDKMGLTGEPRSAEDELNNLSTSELLELMMYYEEELTKVNFK